MKIKIKLFKKSKAAPCKTKTLETTCQAHRVTTPRAEPTRTQQHPAKHEHGKQQIKQQGKTKITNKGR